MITKEQVIEVMKTCNDPELNLDIWTLGLIYNIDINNELIKIKMTFTSPMCPYGPMIVEELKEKLEKANIKNPEVEIVFNPPWQPSQELREMLGV